MKIITRPVIRIHKKEGLSDSPSTPFFKLLNKSKILTKKQDRLGINRLLHKNVLRNVYEI